MSDKSNQNISELIDGELDKNSSEFLLKRLMSDKTLSESWNNYHLIRSFLQKENQAPLLHNMGQSVIAELKGKSISQDMTTSKSSRLLKPFMGSAIAASVAIMAVFMFQSNTINHDNTILAETAANSFKTSDQLITPPAAYTARVEQPIYNTRYPSITPQIQQYLTDRNAHFSDNLPRYYNAEYLNQLKKRKTIDNTAE
ncbi:MAG: sigma-E factor negative regulatory protein [Proteobacteria bacterium]|nr:sigma-E factor negative regulatory protein [Pseudomonadota bacterium]